MEDSVKVSKLANAEEWPLWKFQMKIVINSFELGSLITGDWTRPSSKITKLSDKESDEEARSRYKNQLIAWTKADSKCQKVIVTSVESGPMQYLINCGSAYEMWEKLLSVYEQKSEANMYLLQQKFFGYVKDPTDNISAHISKLEKLTNDLRLAGENITDNMLITKILMTLPNSYQHFYSAWDSMQSENKTINNLTSRLLLEESRLVQQSNKCNIDVEKSSAFTTKSQNKSSWKNGSQKKGKNNFSSSSNTKKIGPCFYCGKVGHIKRECRSFLKNQGQSSDKDDNAFISESTLVSIKDDEQWILDSGASDHMCANYDWFRDYEKLENPTQVKIGNGSSMYAIGTGKILIWSYVKGNWNKNYLLNVLHVPELKYNLFSCGSALDKGLKMISDKHKCVFTRNNKIVCVAERKEKLFQLQFKVEVLDNTTHHVNIAIKDSLRLWHERLGHQNIQYVINCLKNHNITISDKDNTFFCDSCMLGKQHKFSFKPSTTSSDKVGEIIHADLCGPMQKDSIGGSKYFLLIKDDYTHYRMVYFLKHKNEVKNIIGTVIQKVKTDTGCKVKVLRTDNGLEFVNNEITSILQKYGISHQTTVPYTPEQNGKIERDNRTIVEAARTIIHSKQLDISLWAESVNTVVYTLNLTGTSSIKGKTPYELYFNKDPKISHLRIFGTEVFTHIPKEKRQKWDAKSKKGIFVGYSNNTKGYRVWFPGTTNISIFRDVIFKNEINQQVVVYDENQQQVHEIKSEPVENDTESQQEHPNMQLRDRTKLKPPDRYVAQSFVTKYVETEPLTYKEAISCNNATNWVEAMNDEIKSLGDNETWTLVSKPVGANVINNSWVYKIKHNDRFKARLVINGSRQKYGIDYTETFSPVVRYESIRTILAVAAAENYDLKQFDIKTAFLYGNLEEDIYMRQPIGFEDSTERVCKLNKSLYGLKQSPRCWNNRFKQFLLEFKLEQSASDPCIYFNHYNNETLILAIFVDDGLIASSSIIKTNELLQGLEQQFEITQGNLDYFLGMEITRCTDGSICIHQTNYANSIISKFNLLDAKELSTPIDRSHTIEQKLTTSDNQFPYRQAVGNLLFLSQVTRPDIAFAVNYVSRFLNNPTSVHWTMVKRIIRYVKGTTTFGLCYKSNVNLCLSVFSDSDYAGDSETRRSTSGHVFMLGVSTVSWQAQRQPIVTLSSTEAEYISACETIKGLIWIDRLVKEICTNTTGGQPTLYVDNQSAIRLVKNPEFHKRTKHIDVRYHFIREKFEENLFRLQYVETEEQYADIFTKPLPKDRFEKLRQKLSVLKLL